MAALKGTCLVTGSTGRVGKEVIARLSKAEGFTVRAATRTGADYAKSLVRPLKAIFHYYSPSPGFFTLLLKSQYSLQRAASFGMPAMAPCLRQGLCCCLRVPSSTVVGPFWWYYFILFCVWLDLINNVVLTNHQQGAHETVVFDLTDKSTWGPAMEGVTHLFSS